MLALLDRADGELGAFELAVEQWYDEQMAKITGWYKRWARVVLGVVGLIVAVLFNIDTFQVTRTLYVDAPDLAAACFPASTRPVPLRDEILKLGGWAITAFAVSFGAPLWFEALSRLGSLRSAGTPPNPT